MYQYADLPTFSQALTSQQMLDIAFRAMFGNENGEEDSPSEGEYDEMDDDVEAEIEPEHSDEFSGSNRPIMELARDQEIPS